jgi:hypothetical protein
VHTEIAAHVYSLKPINCSIKENRRKKHKILKTLKLTGNKQPRDRARAIAHETNDASPVYITVQTKNQYSRVNPRRTRIVHIKHGKAVEINEVELNALENSLSTRTFEEARSTDQESQPIHGKRSTTRVRTSTKN